MDSRYGNKIKDFGHIGTAANLLFLIMFWVYILKSKKTYGYYIGQTSNLLKRFKDHNSGKGKFTKSGLPWDLIYSEEFHTRAEAMKREKHLKSYKKRESLEKLIAG